MRDDDAEVELLLSGGDIGDVIAQLRDAVARAHDTAARFRAEAAAIQPAPEPEPVPEPPRDGVLELAAVVRALVGVMAAPKEVIRDAAGRVAGVRSLAAAAYQPADLDGALEAIRADLERMSVREVVRDPQTTRVVGVRTIQ